MRTAAEYQKLAEDSLRLVRDAATAEQREILLYIAETWIGLAERADAGRYSPAT